MTQIGHKIIHLDVVDSTNNYVANLVKGKEIVHGTVIMADEQTNGRGQRGTNWQTQAGMNLIFSLFVEFSDLSIEQQASIHHWVALSVCETLNKIGIQSIIKWPNDILTENGKIAGILIENTLSDKNVKHSIIGIGLNINQVDFSGLEATSIRLETGNTFSVNEISFILVNQLNTLFDKLTKRDYSTLKKSYLQKMWGMNQEVSFIRNESQEKGTILGTTEQGLLEIKTANGIEVFDIKDVKFLLDC